MTNGEIIQRDFPNEFLSLITLFTREWWNAEYKESSSSEIPKNSNTETLISLEVYQHKGKDEDRYKLSEWECLYSVLTEYGIDVSHISDRVGKHIVEDFIKTLETTGYEKKVKEEKYSNISSVDDLIAAAPEPTMRPVSEGFFNTRIVKVKDMKEELPSFIIDQAKLRPPKFND